MANKRFLYLMLSRTATKMGKTIRFFTRSKYNHVSLTLDSSFQNWVSFARYTRDVPLAGGFVRESAQRFLSMKGEIPVKIFRVEVSESHYQNLVQLFAMAGNKKCGLIYNTLSALTTPLGFRLPLPGAYTCLDFACAVLGRPFKSLQELEETIEKRLIYQGDLKFLLCQQDAPEPYFAHRGFCGGTWDTVIHFTRLTKRILFPTHYADLLIKYD